MANSMLGKGSDHKTKGIDFEKTVKSKEYKVLMKAKKRFLVPSIILFFGLYLIFPILISYTDILDTPAYGDISWAWIYSLLLFVMTWTLATIYMKKATTFDQMVEDIFKEEKIERREA